MKRSLIIVAVLSAFQIASAQERLPREEALKYAKLVSADAAQLKGTPIPTSVDLTQPVAMRDGDFGGMVLPEAKLTAEAVAKADDKVMAIGQLWLLRLTLQKDGEAVPAEKLRLANVKTDDGDEVKVSQCALGVQRNSAGKLDLVVFGKDKNPLLKSPLKEIETKQESPLEVDAARNSDGAQVSLKILGKYEAKFDVTELYL